VTVPRHNIDVPRPVLASILRQAGLAVEEFLKLL
jgi:predicted RNA binding protein YcfA (HicA-like mRNA interferase family)